MHEVCHLGTAHDTSLALSCALSLSLSLSLSAVADIACTIADTACTVAEVACTWTGGKTAELYSMYGS